MPNTRPDAHQITQPLALDVARLVARANGFEWSDANVRMVIDTALMQRACWRVTLWPTTAPVDVTVAAFWDQPNDVVTLLPPDILIDAHSGALVGLKPLREGVVLVENFGRRYRSP